MRDWAMQKRWEVKAPREATCRKTSAVDFALAMSGTVRRVSARLDWHVPFVASDHAPVLMEWWGRTTLMRPNDNWIPKGRRNDEFIQEAARGVV